MIKLIIILPIILIIIYSFGNSQQLLTKEETNSILVNGLNNIISLMKWKSFNESYTTYSDILKQVELYQQDLNLINNQYFIKNNNTNNSSGIENNSDNNGELLFKQYFNNEIFDKVKSLEIEVRFLKNRIISPDYDSSPSSLERPIRLQQFLKEWSTTLKSLVSVLINSNYPNFNNITQSNNIIIQNQLNKTNNNLEPLSIFRDCDDFYCPELVIIPTGSFSMGISKYEEDYFNGTLAANDINYSKPLHNVSITKQFAISSKEITLEEFSQFIKETGYTMPKGCETPIPKLRYPDFTDIEWDYINPGFLGNDNKDGKNAVVCVRREDGRRYADWLSKKTNQHYRLPYESEWEYSARANTGNNIFAWGNEKVDACKYANVLDLSVSDVYGVPSNNCFQCNDNNPTIAKVGTYLPNNFKIYDMTGNAREWVEDCWHDSFENAPSDGSIWNYDDKDTNVMCKFQVLRGGGWIYDITHLRLAYRNAYYSSQIRSNMWGFRLVREL